MPHLCVRLRDMVTGDEADVHEDVPADAIDVQDFLWTEGNFACDCNRLLILARARGVELDETACGDSRVRIVSATIDGMAQPWADV